MAVENDQSKHRLLVRKVRRIRLKDPASATLDVAIEQPKKTKSAEELKKEKLAKQAENRRKNLQMMMQLQMQAAAEETAT